MALKDAIAISPAAAGVVLSEEFVKAVEAKLGPHVRLVLWCLRDVTGCPEPAAAARLLESALDAVIRQVAADQGRPLAPEMVEQMRGSVVDAVLGEGGKCRLVWNRTLPDRADGVGRQSAAALAGP